MRDYLCSITKKDLKKIANSPQRRCDKSKINKMNKRELVEYILDKKIFNIKNLENWRGIELKYFNDYYGIRTYEKNVDDIRENIKNSSKYEILMTMAEQENMRDELDDIFPNVLTDVISSYSTNFCSNSLHCENWFNTSTLRKHQKSFRYATYNDLKKETVELLEKLNCDIKLEHFCCRCIDLLKLKGSPWYSYRIVNNCEYCKEDCNISKIIKYNKDVMCDDEERKM